MTENELRQRVLRVAKSWLGYNENNGTHKQIIDVYNSNKPLPRGYPVKYTDEWCATFVSAVAIKSGMLDIMPAECSCPYMTEAYKQLGRWQEDDTYKPAVGDIIMYDWQDSGSGDDRGTPDHVGIVAEVKGNTITIIEGNRNQSVKYRSIAIGAKYIRGYCLPDYASKATSAEEAEEMTQEQFNEMANNWLASLAAQGTPAFAQEAVQYFIKQGTLKGDEHGNPMANKPLTRGEYCVLRKREIDKGI